MSDVPTASNGRFQPSREASKYLKISDPTVQPSDEENKQLESGVAHQVLFNVDRSREINPLVCDLWQKDGTDTLAKEVRKRRTNDAFRWHFQSLWGFEDDPITEDDFAPLKEKIEGQTLLTLFNSNALSRLRFADGKVQARAATDAVPFLALKTRAQAADDPVQKLAGRFYVIEVENILEPVNNDPARLGEALGIFQTSFSATLKDYLKAWRRIVSFELAAPLAIASQEAELNRFLPEIEVLDLAAPILQRRAHELAARRDIATIVGNNADKNFLNSAVFADTNPETVQSLTNTYLRLKQLSWDNEEDVALLRAQAGALGYDLKIDSEKDAQGNDKPSVPKLDARAPVRRMWRTTYLREEGDKLIKAYDSPDAVMHSFEVREELILPGQKLNSDQLDFDPWVEKEKKMLSTDAADIQLTGGPFVHVFRFDLTPSGYVTSKGEELGAIMDRCLRDDYYRRQCVLFIPVYEESLKRGLVLTKYRLLKRPLPGIIPRAFPRLFLNESLQYFSELASAEVAELMSTINLAPAEQRKITLTRSVERETEEKRSASSLLDISSENKTDITTEVEKETRKEGENSQSVDASASGGLNLGIVKLGGSAGGSLRWSSKDFERNLNKTVQRASTSLQQRTKQEVTTSVSLRAKSSEVETYETSVKNINDGSTLNLLFFAVNNRLRTGLKLRDLQLLLVAGVEEAEGSGVFPFWRLRLTEADLQRAVNDLWAMRFPLGLEEPLPTVFRRLFLESLLAELERAAREDYVTDAVAAAFKKAADADAANKEEPDPPFILAVKNTKVDGTHKRPYYLPSDKDRGVKIILEWTDAGRPKIGKPADGLPTLAELTYGDMPLAVRIVYFPSRAIYLDAQVGAMPGTETYYQQMREQEVQNRRAAAYKEFASGLLEEAKARWVAGGRVGSLPSPIEVLPITLVQVSEANLVTKRSFKLTLSDDLPQGSWRLLYKNELIARLTGDTFIGERKFQVTTDTPQQWLTDIEENIGHLVLLDTTDATAIVHPRNQLREYFPWLYELAFKNLDSDVSPTP